MAIEVGAKVSGKVSGITNFGAFVDLGEHKTGLVHISEISDSYIKDINDVLKVGDEVTVKVLNIGDDGKIALSIRKAVDKPAHKPHHGNNHHGNNGHVKFGDKRHHNNNHKNTKASFDDLMDNFLKESESRLATIKKNTEGKRGGRGGRRS